MEASPLVPRAAVRSQPLQHLQVAFTRGFGASPLVPLASSFLRPLRDLQVSTLRDARERLRVPRTPSLPRPREPADRSDEVSHLRELSAHRRARPPHVADGQFEDDAAHLTVHHREHREIAVVVEPREHMRGEDVGRFLDESLQD